MDSVFDYSFILGVWFSVPPRSKVERTTKRAFASWSCSRRNIFEAARDNKRGTRARAQIFACLGDSREDHIAEGGGGGGGGGGQKTNFVKSQRRTRCIFSPGWRMRRKRRDRIYSHNFSSADPTCGAATRQVW